MSPRHIFVAIIIFLTLAAATVLILQPGLHQPKKEMTETATEYQQLLNEFDVFNRVKFVECALPKTENRSLTQAEAKECIEQARSEN